MFNILSKYMDKESGEMLYAVIDYTNNTGIEVVTEEELKLIVEIGVGMLDSEKQPVKLNGNELIMFVDELSEGDIDDDFDEDLDEDDLDDGYDYDVDESDEADEDQDEYDSEGDYDGDGYDEEDLSDAYDIDVMEEDDSEDNEDNSDDEDYEDDLDDDMYDIYGVNTPKESTVNKLYKLLNEDQVQLLKKYYLWYSQRLFADAHPEPLTRIKNENLRNKKINVIKQIKQGGDWRYAGFIDTGIDGMIKCNFGHPLRYLHIAWDITVGDIDTVFFGENYTEDVEEIIKSNDCIIFGETCVTDFFEVGASYKAALSAMQRSVLHDMETIYEFFENGTHDQAVVSFEILDKVMKDISLIDVKHNMLSTQDSPYRPMVPLLVSNFYTAFRKNNLCPPKSLIQEIRNCFLGFSDGKTFKRHSWTGSLKFPTSMFTRNLKLLFSKPVSNNFLEFDGSDMIDKKIGRLPDNRIKNLASYSLNDLLKRPSLRPNFGEALSFYMYVFFMYEICGCYKFDGNKNKDEGGASEYIRAELKICYLMAHFDGFFVNIPFDYEYVKTLLSLANLYAITEHMHQDIYNDEKFEFEMAVRDSESETKIYSFYHLCNSSFVKECISDFDKSGHNLAEILYDLRHFFDSASTNSQVTIEDYYKNISDLMENFWTEFEAFKLYIPELNKKVFEENRQKRLAKEAEEAEQARIESERLRAEEEKKSLVAEINTVQKLVDFLKDADLTGIDNEKFSYQLNVFNTVASQDRLPSDKQLRHVKTLFKEVTGVDYEGEGLPEDDDVEEVVTYLSNADLSNVGSEFELAKNIFSTVKRTGNASKNQMYHLRKLYNHLISQ